MSGSLVKAMASSNVSATSTQLTTDQKKVTAVVVGAGNRGKNYARFALECPHLFSVVGVAEPRKYARDLFQKAHSIPSDRCFTSWETLAAEEKLADCAIVSTQDQLHLEPTVALAKKGYHPCVRKLKELIDSGVIGEVVNINHTEPVGFWHFAHSFVRGNWRNTAQSTFSLLAKCCHDVDLIAYWMGNKQCTQLSSFGSLHHFRKEKKPAGGGMRCLECEVEISCPYSAKKIYLDPAPEAPRWPMSVVCDIEDAPEGYQYHLAHALKTGPYGKCVYDTDNDVCDNQINQAKG